MMYAFFGLAQHKLESGFDANERKIPFSISTKYSSVFHIEMRCPAGTNRRPS